MNYSVALTSDTNQELVRHLLREDGQEDLCFGLWYPSTGEKRITALLFKAVLPLKRERQVHGNASFGPEYFERVLSLAMAQGAGIAFLHSHLGPGWQNMSRDDVRAEFNRAGAVKSATGLPMVGLTLGTDEAWSARFWEKDSKRKFQKYWCRNVRVVGGGLSVTYADHLASPPKNREELKRTISAWGLSKQQDLARLKVGVVGIGSVGSIVVEALSRLGIQNILLIDFDKVERHNRDRLLHSTEEDIGHYKTEVISHAANKASTAIEDFVIEQVNVGVTDKLGFKKALDCDVIFSCVDRPWPRSVMNYIAYAHLIPVIDGGISVQKTKQGNLRSADWKAHAALPTRRCLECLEQYDPSLVQLERDGYLDDPAYIEALEEEHTLKNNQNVFPFSLHVASLQVLQMLSLVIKPLGVSNPGEQNYHFVSGTMDVKTDNKCRNNCLYQRIISLGDKAGWKIL